MAGTLRPSPTALLNPRCDPSFKAMFTQDTREANVALADFISAMLDRSVAAVELTTNEPPVDMISELQMSFDVSVVFGDGERASIEMQGRSREYDWKSRAEIQCARLLNVSAKKGGNWQSAKTYQMSVLDFSLDRNDKSGFRWYTMRDKNGGELSALMNALFLELPPIRKLCGTPPERLTKLQKWGLFLSYADKPEMRDYVLSLIRSEEGIMNANAALSTISEDERNWWIQNSIDTARRDYNDGLYNAEKRGERNAKIETARLMLANNMPLADIAKYTGLPEAEIKGL